MNDCASGVAEDLHEHEALARTELQVRPIIQLKPEEGHDSMDVLSRIRCDAFLLAQGPVDRVNEDGGYEKDEEDDGVQEERSVPVDLDGPEILPPELLRHECSDPEGKAYANRESSDPNCQRAEPKTSKWRLVCTMAEHYVVYDAIYRVEEGPEDIEDGQFRGFFERLAEWQSVIADLLLVRLGR